MDNGRLSEKLGFFQQPFHPFFVIAVHRAQVSEAQFFKIVSPVNGPLEDRFQAGTSFIKLAADPNNKLPAITYWLMGSLSGADNEELSFIVWPMLIGLLPLWLMRWRLNVITMGDEEARAMGVDASRVRLAVVFGATLVTAASVSVSGMIGWVGLVIPHMTRRLVGSDYRVLMPASVLAGGTFMLLVDDISRNLTSMEIPIGILTAVIGAPFFLLLIIRRDAWHA